MPDNWIVLAELDADATAEVVAYHGLVPEAHVIVAHTPGAATDPDRVPVSIAVEATDSAAAGEDVTA